MHHAAADQAFDVGVLGRLFAQRAHPALLLGDAPIKLAQRHVIAPRRHERIGDRARIAHAAQRGQVAHAHARRPARRVVDAIGAIPARAHVAQVAALPRDLAPPGHIGGLGAHLAVEGQLSADRLRPIRRQQLALHGVQHRVAPRLVRSERPRPLDAAHLQAPHLKRHEGAVDEAGCRVQQHAGFKAKIPIVRKAAVADAIAVAQARTKRRARYALRAEKGDFRPIRQHDARLVRAVEGPTLAEGLHKSIPAQGRSALLSHAQSILSPRR